MHADVTGWTLADMIDDCQDRLLQQEAPYALAHFVQADGTVRFDVSAHILCASKA